MKTYTVTVNGIAYDVTVEETTGRPARTAAPVYAAPSPVAATTAPVATPQATAPAVPEQETAPTAVTGGSNGKTPVASPMPGKILAVKASIGQSVKRGDVILILEAMKMENEIVAPEAGTVASINVSVGDTVESGTLLATLN